MNLLILSQRIPEPPDRGDKIRAHHFARGLAVRHQVHLACLLDNPQEIVHAEAARHWAASLTFRIRRQTASVLRGAVAAGMGYPMTVGYFRSGALAADIGSLLRRERFDVVVAYCSSMARYLKGYEGAKVVDLVDVDSEKWKQYADRSPFPMRMVYTLEQRLLRTYEQKLVREFDRSILVSQAEREILSGFVDVGKVAVVANGVDTDWWKRAYQRPREPVMVFTGVLDYFANVEGITYFARQVFPTIRRKVPGATLRIVGQRPTAEVRNLAAVEGVIVVGEVKDIRPELWNAAVAVAPLRIARGIQNKVLEAMATQTPIVASPAAVQGIEARRDEHLLVGDTADELAAACERLLTSPDEGEDLAARAREYVVAHHSWEQKAEQYEAVLRSAVEARRVRENGRSRETPADR